MRPGLKGNTINPQSNQKTVNTQGNHSALAQHKPIFWPPAAFAYCDRHADQSSPLDSKGEKDIAE